MKLTAPEISSLTGGKDVTALESLDVSNKDIEEVDDISACVDLKKLNLSKNKIHDLQGINDNKDLTWLNVSNNQMEHLKDLQRLKKLRVLNAGYNRITFMEHVSVLKELRALVLNNNQIRKIEGVGGLAHLDALVLSNNLIEEIEGISKLAELKKLSLSSNKIKIIPDMSGLHALSEIKLNKNMIMKIPDTMSLNVNLKIVDLGNNSIREFKDISALIPLPYLKNLNLKGNPICDKEGYRNTVQQMLPQVWVLDGLQVENKQKKRRVSTTIVTTKREGKPAEQKTEATVGNKRKSNATSKGEQIPNKKGKKENEVARGKKQK